MPFAIETPLFGALARIKSTLSSKPCSRSLSTFDIVRLRLYFFEYEYSVVLREEHRAIGAFSHVN
jgi:hypothetical protein